MSFKFVATYFLALVRRKDMKWMRLGEQNDLKFKRELLSDLIAGLIFPWVLVAFYEYSCLVSHAHPKYEAMSEDGT